MPTTTIPTYDMGDLVYLVDTPAPCGHCGEHLTAPIGVVVDHGIYQTTLVSLIDRTYTGLGCITERVCCSGDELRPVGRDLDGIVHASPENIAAAINAGWLPPGTEFYGCEFRIVQARR